MYDPKNHVIHSANGQLSDVQPKSTTSRSDIQRMIAAALDSSAPDLVIHFHGGLVNEKDGREIAERLWKEYSTTPCYPLFFVWESGLVESIANNLSDIGKDKLFQQLIKKVARWVLKQLPAEVGLKGSGGDVDVQTLEREFDEWFAKTRQQLPSSLEPVDGTVPTLKGATEPKDEVALAVEIQTALGGDFDFQADLQEIYASISPESLANPTPKGRHGEGAVVSTITEIAPSKVAELLPINPSSKGMFGIAKVAMFIAKTVWAVVQRYRGGRDHGAYTTIVEEVLAGAYVDKVGGIIWEQMKKDTADSFADPTTHAGAALLDEIGSQQKATGKSFERIILVGHSTGAVYISNWLEASARLLPNAKFGVVLLAPAVTYKKLAATLAAHAAKIDGFRRFAMRDAVEADDVLVPVIYPRSLLYFVSGLLEFSDNDKPVRISDTPLVGMERFQLHPALFNTASYPEIAEVEGFVKNRSAWSVTPNGTPAGSQSASRKHGDFDNDASTLASLVHILRNGF